MNNARDVIKMEKAIVLVGLMGAGKTSIGRRLAKQLHCPFIDTDEEIEKEQGCTISEIFENQGEEAFRAIEKEMIQRQFTGEPGVVATGGGAFLEAETRQLIKDSAISIWLTAELDVLVERVSRKKLGLY